MCQVYFRSVIIYLFYTVSDGCPARLRVHDTNNNIWNELNKAIFNNYITVL